MTPSQSSKSAPRAHRRSTGHDRARPDIHHRPKIVGQLIQFDAIRRSFVGSFTVAQLVASPRFSSPSSPAALKSP